MISAFSTTSASTTSRSTSTTLPSQTATQQTSEPSTTSSSGSGKLPGGAIARIIIDITAGLAIIAEVYWLLGRRQPKSIENAVFTA